MVQMLLTQGLNPCDGDHCNNTALHYACFENNYDKALALVSTPEGLEAVHSINIDRATPLHLAAIHEYTNICKLLIQSGADPLALDLDGCTPITLALMNGSVSLVHELHNNM